MEKHWQISPKVSQDLKVQLLHNRGLKDKISQENFLHSHFNLLVAPETIFPDLPKALRRIKKAISDKELIYIYGDFDVDGITASAILWETLDLLGAKVLPYIPERVSEGYGLHKEALKKLSDNGAQLVITVDCGITAIEQANYAKELGIDLIITDHHQPQDSLPSSFATLHTTSLSGSGVAFKLANALLTEFGQEESEQFFKNLELATLGTVADMVPLVGENRVMVKNGLIRLGKTQRYGLNNLYREAGLGKNIGTYEIGYLICPRLNAMGRMESALDSLRLLLTRSETRANELAQKLNKTNQDRQKSTIESFEHAKKTVEEEYLGAKLFVIASETYLEGVVGLVAGRITELFHRPSVVISQKKDVSKGSARSIKGFNINEAIHKNADVLLSHGGHPMAAGFSIKPEFITDLRQRLVRQAETELDEDLLTPILTVDTEIGADEVDEGMMEVIKEFEPFGIGNPEPTFLIKKLLVLESKIVGKTGEHFRLAVKDTSGKILEVVGFGMVKKKPQVGDSVDIVCNVRENYWNSKKRLELRLKDLRKGENE